MRKFERRSEWRANVRNAVGPFRIMKNVLSWSAPLVVGLVALFSGCERTSGQDVYAVASPSVVTVVAEDFRCGGFQQSGRRQRGLQLQGSAVAVSNHLLVTNAHVVANACAVTLHGQEREPGRAEIVYSDVKRDIAIMSTSYGIKPARLSSRLPEVGEQVFAIGAPRGLTQTLSNGLVSGVRSDGGARLIQTNAPITHGSSGGGLFDSKGRLLGITTFGHAEGELNFAIPIGILDQLPSIDRDGRPVPKELAEEGRWGVSNADVKGPSILLDSRQGLSALWATVQDWVRTHSLLQIVSFVFGLLMSLILFGAFFVLALGFGGSDRMVTLRRNVCFWIAVLAILWHVVIRMGSELTSSVVLGVVLLAAVLAPVMSGLIRLLSLGPKTALASVRRWSNNVRGHRRLASGAAMLTRDEGKQDEKAGERPPRSLVTQDFKHLL